MVEPTGPYHNIKLNEAIKSLSDYHAVAPDYVMVDHNKDIYYLPVMHAQSRNRGTNPDYIYDSYDPLFDYTMKLHPYRLDKYFTMKKLDKYLDTRVFIETNGADASGIKNEDQYNSLKGFMLPGYERLLPEDTPYARAKYSKDGLIKYSEKTALQERFRSFLVFKKKIPSEFTKDFIQVLGCHDSKKLSDEKCKFWCHATKDTGMMHSCKQGEFYE